MEHALYSESGFTSCWRIGGLCILILLVACGKDVTGHGNDNPDPNRLLTDAELTTPADPNAVDVPADQVDWIRANHETVRSLVSSQSSDLEFLNPLLNGKRIVQLGESSHGTSEYSLLKVRLIRYLHEHLGFNVLAFESGLFECYRANSIMDNLDASQLMAASMFGVWNTSEVASLFDYLKGTRDSGNPLILAGVDVQASSLVGIRHRPQFLKEVVGLIDPGYAEEVFALDTGFAENTGSASFNSWVSSQESDLVTGYSDLAQFLEDNSAELQALAPNYPDRPRVALQCARSMLHRIAQATLVFQEDFLASLGARDLGMANNLDFLVDGLYTNEKIIVWAHNVHIRHANEDISPPGLGWGGVRSMGSYVNERHGPETYTIGLYMYRGRHWSGYDYLDVIPPEVGSMESIMYRVRKKWVFLDLAGQTSEPGNSWIFNLSTAKTFGSVGVPMILKDQYSAILFIDTVSLPTWVSMSVR